MTNDEVNPFSFPDEHLLAVGRVMVNWSLLETAVDFLLIRLLGAGIDDARPHVLLSHMSFQNKSDSLKTASTLSEHMHPQAHAKFVSEIYPKLGDLQAKRNGLVHGKWSMASGDVSQIKLTAKGKLKVENRPVTVESLETLASTIRDLTLQLWMMMPPDDSVESPTT